MSSLPESATVDSLYRTHHAWLFGWLRTRIASPCDAADLAQDTFVRLLSADRRTPLREPRAFLTTVARGLLIDHRRRAALERAYLDELAALPPSLHPSPEEQVLMLSVLSEVDRMLAGIPHKARTAFLLDRVDGVPQRDIAARLGVSERRVRQYLAQALRQCYVVRFGEPA